ncbi:hypothetical protein [Pseudonocardia thermophila]|uniref:hypothetical protein n=1 Tax=Pseudonocardia thermophila TaxID=1848 RepID=UPI00248D99B2|nr:hypothetical protein [Pseudonocardia thermophila]
MTASSPALPVVGWERLSADSRRRLVTSLVYAAVAGGVVLAGRLSGLLEGGVGLGVAVLLVLAVPTSRELSRRVLIAGCAVLGWVPLLWLGPPVPGVGRVTIALVVLAGALAAWVGWSDRPWVRVQQLVPRMRLVDALIPITVVVGLLQLAPWLRAKTAAQSLGLLFSAWDHSAHYAMVSMIRHHGATVDALPEPGGGFRWQFESYPQGFHALLVSIMELQHGARPGDLQAELLAYSQAAALMVVLTAVIVVAGLCALAPLRTRPAVALPVAAYVTTIFYVGPAATAIQGAIGNFTLACALCIAAALVALPAPRALDPWSVLAIGGAVVGVAFTWVLMLALAVPAAALVLLPPRRRWRWSRSAAIVTAVVAVVTALCAWRVLVILGRVRESDPLTIPSGGVPPVNLGLYVVGALGLLAACLLVRHRTRTVQQRLRGLALVPVCGIAVTIGLAVAQIDANYRLSYYGYKFMLGVEIVTLVLLVVPIAYALARLPVRPRSAGTALRTGAASLVLAVSLTQVFGFTLLGFGPRGLVASAPGATAYAAQQTTLVVTPSVADLADRVAELQRTGRVPANGFYVDARTDRSPDPILMAQWYLALTGTWTAEANDVASAIDEKAYRRQPASAVLTILASSSDAVALVPREYRAAILADLDMPILEDRVIGV